MLHYTSPESNNLPIIVGVVNMEPTYKLNDYQLPSSHGQTSPDAVEHCSATLDFEELVDDNSDETMRSTEANVNVDQEPVPPYQDVPDFLKG